MDIETDINLSQGSKILVLGIGNILLGDEGAGVHLIHALEKHKLPENVTLLDGGTGGFHLLSYLQEYPFIIMIDATLDGKESGHISIIKPRFSNEFPRTLSSHDIGLKDLIESVSLIDKLPEIILFTISVNAEQDLGMKLSEEVNDAVISIKEMILQLLNT